MSLQFSGAVRSARVNAIFATIGASAKLVLYTGAPPTNCAAAATGTVLATLSLPAVEENPASNGVATQASGPWAGNASAPGTVGCFRIYDNGLTTCHMQGTVGQGAGDMPFDNNTVTAGQTLNIAAFTLTDPNA